jgi:hypothetical protein
MSKIKQIAIDQMNDCVEIAESVEHLLKLSNDYCERYGNLILDNSLLTQSEKTLSRHLNINTGVVGILKICPEQLVVQFR